jgi:hypothetical protein
MTLFCNELLEGEKSNVIFIKIGSELKYLFAHSFGYGDGPSWSHLRNKLGGNTHKNRKCIFAKELSRLVKI